MQDPRVDRLAELVAGYSLALDAGETVLIAGSEVAAPLLAALYREALRRGANPSVRVELDGLPELVLREASGEQLDYVAPMERLEVELVDAVVDVLAAPNTRALSNSDPARHRRYLARRRRLSNRLWERISAGQARWCGTHYPTHAHAQEAEMPLAEYERLVFAACHVLDGEDPVAYWRGVAAALAARAGELETVRTLRILGPDTDLAVGVGGRTWVAADGRLNMPDGEVFTSPVEDETAGEIRFRLPALYGWRELEDVRLRFERGRVVAAEAARGGDFLRALLEMDEDASIVGEVAFGLNYELDRVTRNVILDEKIGGTLHLALGAGFPETGGRSRSGLHLDLVCDLRAEGEVLADGVLLWRDGAFVREPEPAGDGGR